MKTLSLWFSLAHMLTLEVTHYETLYDSGCGLKYMIWGNKSEKEKKRKQGKNERWMLHHALRYSNEFKQNQKEKEKYKSKSFEKKINIFFQGIALQLGHYVWDEKR